MFIVELAQGANCEMIKNKYRIILGITIVIMTIITITVALIIAIMIGKSEDKQEKGNTNDNNQDILTKYESVFNSYFPNGYKTEVKQIQSEYSISNYSIYKLSYPSNSPDFSDFDLYSNGQKVNNWDDIIISDETSNIEKYDIMTFNDASIIKKEENSDLVIEKAIWRQITKETTAIISKIYGEVAKNSKNLNLSNVKIICDEKNEEILTNPTNLHLGDISFYELAKLGNTKIEITLQYSDGYTISNSLSYQDMQEIKNKLLEECYKKREGNSIEFECNIKNVSSIVID